MTMHFSIDTESLIPIFVQLTEQVRRAVASGVLRADEQLPTVRQLAVELRVNPNTIVRAFRELEQLGIIVTQRGRGTFIAGDAQQVGESDRRNWLREMAQTAITDARTMGFTPHELRDAIDVLAAEEGSTNG